MTLAMFGFLSDTKEALAEFANNCLLVAGGFLVGYLLGGVVGWALGKYVFRQKDPESLRRLGKPVCGVLLALIVAVIVFTGKGKSTGDGGNGKGNPDSPNGTGQPKPEDLPKVNPKLPPPKPIDPKPADFRVEVTIHGGIADDKLYQLESEEGRKALDEVVAVIKSRKGDRKVMLVLRSPAKDYLPPEHPGVKRLTERAHMEGFDVTFPADK